MKFVIPTQEFNYLISKCFNVVSQKAPVPILSNLLIEASNNLLTITATDLIVSIRCVTEAKILEEGATTLPAKCITQLVKEIKSANLEVSTNSHDLTEISADGSRFRVNGMSHTEFPALPELDSAVSFSIKQAELKNVLFSTAFAVSREDSRFVLAGISLSIENGRATFVGTDGKRLSRSFFPVSLDPSFTGNFVIPLKAVEEAQKNLSEDEAEATIYLMTDKIAIKTQNVTLIAKLLSGDYPDVSPVIASPTEKIVSLHREELTALLRQVSLFTGDNQAARFNFSNGELHLTAADMKVGEGNTSMPVNYHGEPLSIAFNPGFFLDILRHSKGETITMGISDPFNPGIIADQHRDPFLVEDISPVFVLMPLRLSDD